MGITQTCTLRDDEQTVTPNSYRILVVDDDKNCAQTTMWTLEMLGHTVKMALDGPTAIELAKSFHPQVTFLDIGLKGMTGYDICRAMREESSLQDSILVALTGWGQKEHRERTKEAGFHYHLVKPVDIEALKNILLVLDKKETETAA